MKKNINKLITYANECNLLKQRDNVYMYNVLCEILDVEVNDTYRYTNCDVHIDDLLDEIANAYKNFETPGQKEQFKSKIIGTIMPRPAEIETRFDELYIMSPNHATAYYYQLVKDANYVKERMNKKNIIYQIDSKYGLMDITINIAKPEKTTEEIALLKKEKKVNWPLCFLCKEQEGFYGNIKNPDRANHRLVSIDLNNTKWYFQYSPYSYFNEHAIVLSSEHKDMSIGRETFDNLLTFVEKFPHYMIGSNADLPIVGGSMLTHDHYQAGNYEFPIFSAKSTRLKTINNVEIHSILWPLHTVKLIGNEHEEILETALLVLEKWKYYEDVENNIFSATNEPHNTITPIVTSSNGRYEMYLILRNNYQSKENPDGIFHVHTSRHHIKQENIGLIEAMGLAVLPGRLKYELEEIASCLSLPQQLEKHRIMYDRMLKDKPKDKLEYLYKLTGEIFIEGLNDCGVFKYNEEKYFDFIRSISE